MEVADMSPFGLAAQDNSSIKFEEEKGFDVEVLSEGPTKKLPKAIKSEDEKGFDVEILSEGHTNKLPNAIRPEKENGFDVENSSEGPTNKLPNDGPNSCRKSRFNFSIERDIFLLQTIMSLNPWQYGDEQWTEAVQIFAHRNWIVTQRTLQSRIKVLREQFKNQLVVKRNGTEEQKSERASLLADLEVLIYSANKAANQIFTFSVPELELDCSTGQELDVNSDAISVASDTSVGHHSTRKDLNETDKRHYQSASEFESMDLGRKRARQLEESLFIRRAEHEMEMNSRRQDLEEARERRLTEEGKRRDELATAQLELQRQQVELLKQQQRQQMMLLQLLVDRKLSTDNH